MALSEAGKILLSSSNAPKAVIRGAVQAGKATSAQAAISWGLAASGGLCSKEFCSQAAVRWNEAGLCGPLKRDPHDPPIR
jgi:hypothetical protein